MSTDGSETPVTDDTVVDHPAPTPEQLTLVDVAPNPFHIDRRTRELGRTQVARIRAEMAARAAARAAAEASADAGRTHAHGPIRRPRRAA